MAGAGVGLFARYSSTLERWVQFGIVSGRVIKLDFLVDRPSEAGDTHPLLDRLERYLDKGELLSFEDVEIALTGPTSHRPVYDTLRQVPYGSEIDVQTLIERSSRIQTLDEPKRIVHEAIGSNPVPILVPDHRVREVTARIDPEMRAALRNLEDLD